MATPTPRGQRAKNKRKRFDVRTINEHSKRFVYRLSTLIRTARIHSMSNQAMNYSLGVAAKASSRLVADMGEVTLLGEGETVHVNDLKVKVARSMVSPVTFLNSFLHERGLGGFVVMGETHQGDWRQLLDVLMVAPEVGDEVDASPSLNARLGESGVEQIRFAPPLKLRKGTLGAAFGGEGRSVEIAATRAIQLYVRAIRAVDHMRSARHRVRISVGVSRVVQYLVELAVEEPRHHLALIHLKDSRLPYDLQHPVNTAILAIAVGHRVGLNRASLLDLGLSAMACDLGVLQIPSEIREKTTPLSMIEQAEVERHPLYSSRVMLQAARLDLSVRRRALVTLEHHLGFDRGGFPAVLRWENLHLFTRILGICERFDELTTARGGAGGLLPDEALAQMVEESGASLDPALVAVFINMLGRFPMGSLLLLSTGEVGVVYLNHPDPADQTRPVIRLLLDARGDILRDPVVIDLREKGPDGAFTRSPVRTVDPVTLGVDLQRVLYS